MRFRARKTFHIGPLYMTVNQAGRLSFSIRIWRYTYNLTRRTSSFDTPGPGGFHHQHKRRS
jgi:hypothetical protein